MRPEQQRVKQLLTEAITLLCRNSLQFKEDVTVEGLLGITLDKSDIFLVSIHETVQQTLREVSSESRAEKRNVDNGEQGSPTSKKRRRHRRGSREGSSSPPPSPESKTPAGDDSQPEPEPDLASERVNIKREQTSESDSQPQQTDWPEDGRKFNPAHVSTPARNQPFSPSHASTPSQDPGDSKAVAQQQIAAASSQHPSTSQATSDNDQVQVKQEQPDEEEEDCYMIDSDSQAGSDTTSHSLTHDQSSLGAHSWASSGAGGGDQGGGGFNLTELDMISAANFQQQFGNLANMGGGNMGPGGMPFMDPSVMGSPGAQPGTSGTQEGSQRGRYVCVKCGRTYSKACNLYRHDRDVHLNIRKHQCPICLKRFCRAPILRDHIVTIHYKPQLEAEKALENSGVPRSQGAEDPQAKDTDCYSTAAIEKILKDKKTFAPLQVMKDPALQKLMKSNSNNTLPPSPRYPALGPHTDPSQILAGSFSNIPSYPSIPVFPSSENVPSVHSGAPASESTSEIDKLKGMTEGALQQDAEEAELSDNPYNRFPIYNFPTPKVAKDSVAKKLGMQPPGQADS